MRRFSPRIKMLSLFLIALVFMLVTTISFNRNAVSQDHWRIAKDSAPTGLLDQLVRENLYPGIKLDAGHMKLWKIEQSNQFQPLYLVDTRTTTTQQSNPLCGQQHCLFLGYIQASDR